MKDKIIVGVAGAEYGVRGFLDAYDASTGKRAWRLWTVPGPGEPGHETWSGDSWKYGGATTWVTGAYDPDTNLTYWGTGNPGPDFIGDVRAGDNLYSDSLIAVDVDTGALKWHFQFIPHDVNDIDSTEIPILVDAEFRGRPRKLLLFANRNGFYYVFDRVTGEYLHAQPFARQTWAKGLDEKGRPIPNPDTVPSPQGALVYPDDDGYTNWFSPSYSPQTKLFYQNVREKGGIYYRNEAVLPARTDVPRRQQARRARRGAVGGAARARLADRRREVGIQGHDAALVRPAVHGRPTRVLGHDGRDVLRARCGVGRAAVAIPDRGRDLVEPDQLPGRRPPVHRHRGGEYARRLRAGRGVMDARRRVLNGSCAKARADT